MKVFGKTYASAYDTLYKSKDYQAECDFVQDVLNSAGKNVKSVLDLGCGTGGHALILAERGYKVTGVDRSEDMLAKARKKTKKSLGVRFLQGDITSVNLNRKYDAVISMFAVMGYMTGNDDLAAACRTARKHLNKGGIFIFDCWNGAAVLSERPEMRIREIPVSGNETIIRFTEPVIDTFRHVVETKFKLWRVSGKSLKESTSESHFMRFLFPQEISYFLKVAGFSKVEICPFLKYGDRISENDWNISIIATA